MHNWDQSLLSIVLHWAHSRKQNHPQWILWKMPMPMSITYPCSKKHCILTSWVLSSSCLCWVGGIAISCRDTIWVLVVIVIVILLFSYRSPKGLSGIVCRCVHRMLWTIIWSTLNLALQKPKWYSVFEITSLSICDICLGQFSVGPFLRAPAIPSKTRLEANLFKRMIHSVAKTFQ